MSQFGRWSVDVADAVSVRARELAPAVGAAADWALPCCLGSDRQRLSERKT